MSLIKNIIVLGDNEHAWFSAAILAFNCPWLQVAVVGEQGNENGFYAASTRSDLQHFFGVIGLPWQELLFSASATYKLANQYVNCGKNKRDFFHSYGVYGADFGLFEFHQIVKAFDSFLAIENYDAYSLESQAAKAGKFIVDHESAWGLHYDRMALYHLLKIYAQKLGVITICEKIIASDFEGVGGTKTSVTTEGGIYRADFYIDARPVDLSKLNSDGAGVCSWLNGDLSEWCLTAHLEEHKVYLPATEYRRIGSRYWIKKIPLQSKTVVELYGIGLVPQQNYSDVFSALGYTINTGSARLVNLNSGRRKSFWNGNCLAVGEASAALGNLPFPALDITRFQMEKFLMYFPEKEQNCNLVAEYNRISTQAVDSVLNYHRFIFSVLLKDDFIADGFENFPAALRDRIELFMSTGRYEFCENDLIPKDEWISLFMGLGVAISRHDPLIGVDESAKLVELLKSINAGLVKTAAEMPNHLIFLSQFIQSKNMR